MDYVRCPQCERPAAVVDRFTLRSTDGPVEYVKTRCLDGHWFTPPAQDVDVNGLATPAASVAA